MGPLSVVADEAVRSIGLFATLLGTLSDDKGEKP